MLKRYSNIDYVLNLPLKRSIKLINLAFEKENEEYFYRYWLVRYPLYTEANYESFSQFYDRFNPKNNKIDKRSKDEIMQDILGIT